MTYNFVPNEFFFFYLYVNCMNRSSSTELFSHSCDKSNMIIIYF